MTDKHDARTAKAHSIAAFWPPESLADFSLTATGF
jgi:hypothetical protein